MRGVIELIDNELETFTAAKAVAAGLLDAIKNGTAVVEGSYRITSAGAEINQRAFVFKDRWGGLRVGRFKTMTDLLEVLRIANKDESAGIDAG